MEATDGVPLRIEIERWGQGSCPWSEHRGRDRASKPASLPGSSVVRSPPSLAERGRLRVSERLELCFLDSMGHATYEKPI